MLLSASGGSTDKLITVHCLFVRLQIGQLAVVQLKFYQYITKINFPYPVIKRIQLL